MQNSIELDIKNIWDPKSLAFKVWSLKSSLGLIKPLVENPSSNFHNQDLNI